MTFQRTRSALGSMHLFYYADVVVFCEGGASRTASDALAFFIDGRTLDAMYWANVVNFHGLAKIYHFKSVGSKETLLTIAEDVHATGCTTVTVCLDADYDAHLGQTVATSRVAYTFGYSWESDVLHRSVIMRVLTHFVGPPPQVLSGNLVDALTQLEADLVPWCEIDIALRAKSKPCVFDRAKPLSVVDLMAEPPCINVQVLRRRLTASGYRRRPRRVVKVHAATVLRIAFGKLVSKLIYHLVVTCAKKVVPKIRVDYDDFMRVAMSETFALLRSGKLADLAAHMATQRPAFL